ncbi:MAG TPA: hypothetical protein VH370_08805 [Humisphaera sp.]|nr:hypothetical protein [Humisphaera sp.]
MALSRREFIEAFGAAGLSVGTILASLTFADSCLEDPPQDAGRAQEALRALADRLEKQFKALEAAGAAIPRQSFDPQAIVAAVGNDPTKLFEWVRDQTFLVSYRGMLRGPAGVLMDRLGNSLDRSLLLADLLRRAGHKSRLANAPLSAAQAAELLAGAKDWPAAPHAASEPADTARRIDALGKEFGLDASSLKQYHAAAVEASKALADQMAQRLARQIPSITRDLQGTLSPPAGNAANASDPLRDHWWVQLDQAGKWLDLDPNPSGAKPGAHLAVPTRFLESRDGKSFPIDASLAHELRIRVIVEQWTEQRLRESVALEQTIRPADLYGKRLALSHIPLDWPENLDLSNPDEARAKLKEAAAAQKSWMPVLHIGDETKSHLPFNEAGDTKQEIAKADKGSPAGLGAGLGGFGFGGGGDERPASKLSAEWIEYEFRAPGTPPLAVRRDMFDLIGPAARAEAKGRNVPEPSIDDNVKLKRALALMERTDILPITCQIPAAFVESMFARDMLANREFLLGAVHSALAGDNQKTAAKPAPLAGQLYNWAVARSTWSGQSADLYVDRINLVTYRLQTGLDPDGELTIANGFDIVANKLAARPKASKALSANLAQGIMETNAEALFGVGLGPVQNTAELLEKSAAQEIKWLAFRNGNDARWEQIEVSPDVRARINQDMASGYAVLVPQKSVELAEGLSRFGWWRVNPSTGEALGRMESGAGQALTERIITTGIRLAPSAIAAGLKYQCGKSGNTSGICNPCLIAAIGLFGCFIGFANAAVAWTLGESSTLAFGVLGVGAGAYGMASNAGGCVGFVLDSYAH